MAGEKHQRAQRKPSRASAATTSSSSSRSRKKKKQAAKRADHAARGAVLERLLQPKDGTAYAEAPVLTAEARAEIASDRQAARRENTKRAYDVQQKKIEWFLHHTRNEQGQLYNPDLSQPGGLVVATLFLKWVGDNCPGFDYPRKKEQMSRPLLESIHSALQAYYAACQTNSGSQGDAGSLFAYAPYKQKYDTIMENMCKKGERPTGGVDSLAHTTEQTFTQEQLDQVLTALWVSSDAKDAKWACLYNFLRTCVARFDDAWQVNMSDLLSPILVQCLGPSPFTLVAAVLHAGKTQKNGKLSFAGGGRHLLPAWDLHNSMGKNFVVRHTIQKVPFPRPDLDEWYDAPLIEGLWQNQAVSYRQAAQVLARHLEALGIQIDKVLHAFRVYAAQALDGAGVDDTVIARLGRWLRQALYNSYLKFFKPEGLLAAAGWPGAVQRDFQTFFHPRFCIPVSNILVDHLMPWLVPLEEKVAAMGRAAKGSHRAVPRLLRYLAMVLVQDAAAGGVEEAPDNPVHKLLVQSQEFRELCDWYHSHKEELEAHAPVTTREQVVALRDEVAELKDILLQQHQQRQASVAEAAEELHMRQTDILDALLTAADTAMEAEQQGEQAEDLLLADQVAAGRLVDDAGQGGGETDSEPDVPTVPQPPPEVKALLQIQRRQKLMQMLQAQQQPEVGRRQLGVTTGAAADAAMPAVASAGAANAGPWPLQPQQHQQQLAAATAAATAAAAAPSSATGNWEAHQHQQHQHQSAGEAAHADSVYAPASHASTDAQPAPAAAAAPPGLQEQQEQQQRQRRQQQQQAATCGTAAAGLDVQQQQLQQQRHTRALRPRRPQQQQRRRRRLAYPDDSDSDYVEEMEEGEEEEEQEEEDSDEEYHGERDQQRRVQGSKQQRQRQRQSPELPGAPPAQTGMLWQVVPGLTPPRGITHPGAAPARRQVPRQLSRGSGASALLQPMATLYPALTRSAEVAQTAFPSTMAHPAQHGAASQQQQQRQQESQEQQQQQPMLTEHFIRQIAEQAAFQAAQQAAAAVVQALQQPDQVPCWCAAGGGSVPGAGASSAAAAVVPPQTAGGRAVDTPAALAKASSKMAAVGGAAGSVVGSAVAPAAVAVAAGHLQLTGSLEVDKKHAALPALSTFNSKGLQGVWEFFHSGSMEYLAPAVLEQRYGARWRPGEQMRKQMFKYMTLVKAVTALTQPAAGAGNVGGYQQLSIDAALQQLEAQRGTMPVATFLKKLEHQQAAANKAKRPAEQQLGSNKHRRTASGQQKQQEEEVDEEVDEQVDDDEEDGGDYDGLSEMEG